MRSVTTATSFQHRFDTFAERILWVRHFELGIRSRSKMAETLGEGFNDSTLGTWEDGEHEPRKMHMVAKRYEALAQAAGATHITADWIMYGGPVVKIDSRLHHFHHAA